MIKTPEIKCHFESSMKLTVKKSNILLRKLRQWQTNAVNLGVEAERSWLAETEDNIDVQAIVDYFISNEDVASFFYISPYSLSMEQTQTKYPELDNVRRYHDAMIELTRRIMGVWFNDPTPAYAFIVRSTQSNNETRYFSSVVIAKHLYALGFAKLETPFTPFPKEHWQDSHLAKVTSDIASEHLPY